MGKSRIDITIDEDLSLWIRNSFSRGQLSNEVNDYLRMRIQAERNNPDIQEKEKVLSEIEELKDKAIDIQKELMSKNIELQQIRQKEIEQAEERKEFLRKQDLQTEAILNSGFLERITR